MKSNIRLVRPSDYEAILAIYQPYVANTTISFEDEAPSLEEFSRRIDGISAVYPYLVYESEGTIIGYAYASKHKARAAYRFNVEVSIYLSPKFHGGGIAKKLYDCLLELLRELGYYNAYAVCTVPNDKSIRFHEKCGFTNCGTLHKTGYKFGAWHDIVNMEKKLREYTANPTEALLIGELAQEKLSSIIESTGAQE